MKILRALCLVLLAFGFGFFAAHFSAAESPNQRPQKNSDPDYYFSAEELASLVTYLQDNKQTNVMERFNRFLNASTFTECSAGLGDGVIVSRRIREGNTNGAIKLLEIQIEGNITLLAAAYRELPPGLREKASLTPLKMAKEYCDKYGLKGEDKQGALALADAFKLLDEKTTP